MVYTLREWCSENGVCIAQDHGEGEEWDLEQLTENLRKYVDRNLLKAGSENKADNGSREWPHERDKLLFGNGQNSRKYCNRCVYCGSNKHYSSNCK